MAARGGGGVLRWRLITTAGLDWGNIGDPVNRWYAVAASEYWSARPSIGSSMSCSGAAYGRVPIVMFVAVNPLISPADEQSRSRSVGFAAPVLVTAVSKQNIRGFDVAMENTALIRVVEGTTDRGDNLQDVTNWHASRIAVP